MPSLICLSFLIIFLSIFLNSHATVPPSRTFQYVNNGDFGEYSVEYSADYRPLDIATFPFTLCFYNATPNAFILGLRMGHRRSESVMRWVWDANRRKPVKENATLTFSGDGNLVLADADGTVAWQTNTANTGVFGLKILPNGNLVLYDNKGKYIWQSFEHPTDTLLVGQALWAGGGPIRLVGRKSITEAVNGPYSFVMEKRYWAMYYEAKNGQNPVIYYKSDEFGNGKGALAYLDFYSEPENDKNFAYELGFRFNMSNSDSSGTSLLSRPKFSSTYSMLRVDVDGNLRIYTFDENVDWGAWGFTYVLFDKGPDGQASECKLPRRCGLLGVCDEDQCVACPTRHGLLGWSKACTGPVLPSCNGKNVDYYKVDGVEHYTSAYNEGIGRTTLAQCKNKCSKDCMCLGFFYRPESSKCLVVHDLGTLVKVSNTSHVGYIKMAS